MNSPLCLMLAEMETMLWRMTAGVFRFVFHGLWEWIVRTLFDVIGPLVFRMIRVALALSFWLAVLLGPAYVLGTLLGWSESGPWAAMAWAALALSGSIWGLYRIKKQRVAAAAAAVTASARVLRPSAPVARLIT